MFVCLFFFVCFFFCPFTLSKTSPTPPRPPFGHRINAVRYAFANNETGLSNQVSIQLTTEDEGPGGGGEEEEGEKCDRKLYCFCYVYPKTAGFGPFLFFFFLIFFFTLSNRI